MGFSTVIFHFLYEQFDKLSVVSLKVFKQAIVNWDSVFDVMI